MKIEKAIYSKGEVVEEILATSLTRVLYYQKYRGYLFCPEPDCNAVLSFVERKKNNLKYFRTWSKKKHKVGCKYEVNYDGVNIGKGKTGEEERFNVSDSHVANKLKRAF